MTIYNTHMQEVVLNPEQEDASYKFTQFLIDPAIREMVLEGHAGTGKTFLVRYLLSNMAGQMDFIEAVMGEEAEMLENVHITATTHKAAQVLQELTGTSVLTVHAFLKLKLQNNFENGTKYLVPTNNEPIPPSLIVVDEASFVTPELLSIIRQKCQYCKVLYLGDPYQLAPTGEDDAVVFNSGLFTAKLTQIMRNGGEIQRLSHKYRDVLLGQGWPAITSTPDVIHMNGNDTQAAIDAAFKAEENVKILAYTNQRVNEFNAYVSNLLGRSDRVAAGQQWITNNTILRKGGNILSESLVRIDYCEDATEHGIQGQICYIHGAPVFVPDSYAEMKRLLTKLRKDKEFKKVFDIQDNWGDLRHPYASTVHKSQGSTYDKVIIDLRDIAKCRVSTDVARMLYVAISRASKQVILGGYLPSYYTGV